MTKMLLFVSGAIVIGFALQSCSSTRREPEIDATHRVANCTVLLNGKSAESHPFTMSEQIALSGEMEIVGSPEPAVAKQESPVIGAAETVRPADEPESRYMAFLVALDHRVKDVVADSGVLQASVQNGSSKYTGRLKAPKRAGRYELRLFFIDSRHELQAMDPVRLFFRIPVTVTPATQ